MLEDWSCDMLLDWALWLRSCSVVAACCCCIDLGKRRAVKSSKDKKRSGPIGPMCNRFFQPWYWIVFCPRFQRVSTSAHKVMEVPRQKTDEHRWIEMKNDEEKLTKSQLWKLHHGSVQSVTDCGPSRFLGLLIHMLFACFCDLARDAIESPMKTSDAMTFITCYYNILQSSTIWKICANLAENLTK